MNKIKILTQGLIKENPTLVLVLGGCPSLAVTSSVNTALGMGLATTFVLFMGNSFVSLFRNHIPHTVRIPAYIVIIASFVAIVELLLKGFMPPLAESLGIFIPLIVANCVLLGRAEVFASKNKVVDSFLDGLGMGLGFTFALFLFGTCREVLGNGTFMGFELIPGTQGNAVLGFILAPGAFFVMGFVIAIMRHLRTRNKVTSN